MERIIDEGDLVGTGHDRQTHNIQTYGRIQPTETDENEMSSNISGFGTVLKTDFDHQNRYKT